MMKLAINAHRLFCVFFFALAVVITASAIPANSRPVDVTQSDGTRLTIRLVGDEFYHRTVTADGYTVIQRDNGDYVYAQQHGASLMPSNVIAHDSQSRKASEQSLHPNFWSVMACWCIVWTPAM